MFRRPGLLLLLLLLVPAPSAAQSFNARRMAMGGVILGGRTGGEGDNVAYRAMPRPQGRSSELSLPIGLIPLIADPPVLDPNDPDFNAYRLLNLLDNPPWNLPLVAPTVPSNDISIDLAQNSLAVQLGDLGSILPADRARVYGTANGPSAGFTVRRVFLALAPLVQYENDLELNDALRGALRDGQPFAPLTRYGFTDHGRAQVAAALHLGTALPLLGPGDPRRGATLFGGLRVKVLRGLAYGEAWSDASFTTGDTLFASQPVDPGVTGRMLDAQPADGGLGMGFDAGAVWASGPLEFGLAADDIGTQMSWRMRETQAVRDSATGDYHTQVIATGLERRSTVPVSIVANAALRTGAWTIAADVRRNEIATVAHAGAELWLGWLALRAGSSLDEQTRVQVSGGTGVRLGRLGLDLAVATNQRNLEHQRTVELGAGIALYH